MNRGAVIALSENPSSLAAARVASLLLGPQTPITLLHLEPPRRRAPGQSLYGVPTAGEAMDPAIRAGEQARSRRVLDEAGSILRQAGLAFQERVLPRPDGKAAGLRGLACRLLFLGNRRRSLVDDALEGRENVVLELLKRPPGFPLILCREPAPRAEGLAALPGGLPLAEDLARPRGLAVRSVSRSEEADGALVLAAPLVPAAGGFWGRLTDRSSSGTLAGRFAGPAPGAGLALATP